MKGNLRKRKRAFGSGRRMLAGAALAAVLGAGLFGCGKETAGEEESAWRDYDHACDMEEGMAYLDYNAGLVKFLDYETGAFYPLCVRPNCFHDSEECFAHALCEQTRFMGRLGEKWYYWTSYDGETALHSCDLDGGNDRVIETYAREEYEGGHFEGNVWGNVLFRDGSCFLALGMDKMEDLPNNPDGMGNVATVSGIYRYDLDTGEREALCPEKTMSIPSYTLWGSYKNQLIYSELLNDEGGSMVSGLRKLDLETKEVEELDIVAREILFPGCVSGNFLLYNKPEGGLVAFDLDSGEKTMILEDEAAGDIVWEEDLKAFSALQSSETGGYEGYRVYQYTEEGECQLLYEGETVFLPRMLRGDWVIGYSVKAGQSMLRQSIIKKEDFLAGKTNWTLIVEEE